MKRRTWLNMLMLAALAVGIVMSWDGEGTVIQASSALDLGSEGKQEGKKNANHGAEPVGKQFGVSDSQSEVTATEAIPEDAIRLRILAHSDEDADQAVKRQVRDAVVEAMNGWLEEGSTPRSREEARSWIELHMEQIQEIAEEVVEQAGYSYGVKAELKVVPFPAKLYGGQAYPAGNYEALRITLGSGEGQNWWCVLFPPLCFVDGNQGTAVAAESEQTGDREPSGQSETKQNEKPTDGSSNSAAVINEAAEDASTDREVRFFLWDVLVSIFKWIGEVFGALF